MKRVKILALLGIILAAVGILGSFMLLGEGDNYSGILGLLVYGFLLWFSIEVRNIREK